MSMQAAIARLTARSFTINHSFRFHLSHRQWLNLVADPSCRLRSTGSCHAAVSATSTSVRLEREKVARAVIGEQPLQGEPGGSRSEHGAIPLWGSAPFVSRR